MNVVFQLLTLSYSHTITIAYKLSNYIKKINFGAVKIIISLSLIFCFTASTLIVIEPVANMQKTILEKEKTFIDPETWYRSQIGTGLGNCGPSCAAMLVTRSGTSISVLTARSVVGYNAEDGSTNFGEIKYILKRYNIKYKELASLYQYDGNGVILIVFDTTNITNKPYSYNGGHYIILTGIAGKYYVANDPLSGPNVLYSIDEINKSLTGYPILIE